MSKADNDNKESGDVAVPSPSSSALRVTVLSELEGMAYIQVAIRELAQSGGEDLL